MVATSEVVVRREGPVRFTMGADDGYQLWVDGDLVIDDWASGSYRSKSTLVDLDPGVHALRLAYFEGTLSARLSSLPTLTCWSGKRRQSALEFSWYGQRNVTSCIAVMRHPTSWLPNTESTQAESSRCCLEQCPLT